MERNAVAAFLLMLRNFLQGHPVNQESLVQCQGPAILGVLLRKVGLWAGEGLPVWVGDQEAVRKSLLGGVAFERGHKLGD